MIYRRDTDNSTTLTTRQCPSVQTLSCRASDSEINSAVVCFFLLSNNKIVRLFCGLGEWATVVTALVPVKNVKTHRLNQIMVLSVQYIENITHNGTRYRDFTCSTKYETYWHHIFSVVRHVVDDRQTLKTRHG